MKDEVCVCSREKDGSPKSDIKKNFQLGRGMMLGIEVEEKEGLF